MSSSLQGPRGVPEEALPRECPAVGQRAPSVGHGPEQARAPGFYGDDTQGELPYSEIERRRVAAQELEQREKLAEAEARALAAFDAGVARFGGSVALAEASGVDFSDIDKMRKGKRQVQYRLVQLLLSDPTAAEAILTHDSAAAGFEPPRAPVPFTREELAEAALVAVLELQLVPLLLPHLQRLLCTHDPQRIYRSLGAPPRALPATSTTTREG